MLKWTIKELFASPLQLFASIGAIAGAFLLVLFFEAVFAGESDQIVAYIQQSKADVWVMQKGVSNMHMANSFLADWKIERIGEVEGVAKVSPILYLNTVMKAGGREWFSFIVGMEANDLRAGPWQMVVGNAQPGPGETIVPSIFASSAGLAIGDTVSIAGKTFTIAGLSSGTYSMANSIIFITMADLSDIMSTIGSVSYLLVDAAPGVDASVLAERIRDSVEKVNALPTSQFAANDWSLAMQMGLEIVSMMTIIGASLAVILTGFIIYSHVTSKEREIAVMKALGVRDRTIYFGITFQAISMTILAFLLAALLVLLSIPLTDWLLPQVSLALTGTALARVGAIAVVVAAIASIMPVRRVLGVDPASAFKE